MKEGGRKRDDTWAILALIRVTMKKKHRIERRFEHRSKSHKHKKSFKFDSYKCSHIGDASYIVIKNVACFGDFS